METNTAFHTFSKHFREALLALVAKYVLRCICSVAGAAVVCCTVAVLATRGRVWARSGTCTFGILGEHPPANLGSDSLALRTDCTSWAGEALCAPRLEVVGAISTKSTAAAVSIPKAAHCTSRCMEPLDMSVGEACNIGCLAATPLQGEVARCALLMGKHHIKGCPAMLHHNFCGLNFHAARGMRQIQQQLVFRGVAVQGLTEAI